jgi:hypothetical protein
MASIVWANTSLHLPHQESMVLPGFFWLNSISIGGNYGMARGKPERLACPRVEKSGQSRPDFRR